MTHETPPDDYTAIVNQICKSLLERPEDDYNTMTIHHRLNEIAKTKPNDATLKALADACAYYFLYEGADAPFACGPYAPQSSMRNEDQFHTYPRPLDQVKQEVLDLWSACASDEALDPLVRSRLADLLWVRRQNQRPPWFEVAIQEFTKFANSEAHVLEREQALRRAIAICNETNRPDLRSELLEVLARLARESIDSSESMYGVTARALEVLALNQYPCADLLQAAIWKYDADPFEISGLRQIAMIATSDEDEEERLQRERIAAFETSAQRSSSFLRLSRLQDAQAIARDAGLADEVNRLGAEIENVDLSDDWIRLETSIEFSREEVESFVDLVVGSDSTLGGLVRFSNAVPIDQPEATEAAVLETERQFPLLARIGKLIIGPNNSFTQIPNDTAKRIDVARAERDALAIEVFASIFGTAALREIHDRYEPDPQDIVDCFGGSFPQELARRIALSYRHWANEDYESAVCVVVSALEPMVRHICTTLGINVTGTRGRAEHNSEIRGLRALLDDLEPYIDPLQARYLKAALVDRLSLNLRNLLSHGLIPELTEPMFVTLFHVACILRRIAEVETTTDPRPKSSNE